MKFVILGASAAGIEAAKNLRKLNKNIEITLVSEDSNIYSRCKLHHYISGKISLDQLKFIEDDFFKKNNINWLGGSRVIAIDEFEKNIQIEGGCFLSYDKLLISTGASALIPKVENMENRDNLYLLRNLEDAANLKKVIKKSKSVTILGGGLIGSYLGAELLKMGLEVNIIEASDNILSTQLDSYSSKKYHNKILENSGRIYSNSLAKKAIIGKDNKISALELNDGRKLASDIFIVTAGSKPNIDFLKNSSLNIDDGIIVDEYCQTNIQSIFAAGDVCQHRSGIWPLASRQAKVAAYNMLGYKKKMDNLFSYRKNVNIFNINTISLGNPNLEGDDLDIEIIKCDKNYRKVILKNGEILSAIFQGNLDYVEVYERLIRKNINIEQIKKSSSKLSNGEFFHLDQVTGEYYYLIS